MGIIKHLTAAEENKSMTAVGDSRSLIVEDETSLDPFWGIRETLEISTGNQTKENLDLLENKEDSDGFCGEMRIFNLLGELKILMNLCWVVMKTLEISLGN